jgi:hypothetical protein
MVLLITPAEIAVAVGVSVSEAEAQVAQDVVELYSGRDIGDADFVTDLTARDLRRLKLAIQWQAKYLSDHPEVLSEVPLKRASANGAMIEKDGDGILSPLASKFLNQCSWAAGDGPVSVVTLRPSLPYRRTMPDQWTRIG